MQTANAAAPTLRDYDWTISNSSSGKDSACTLDVLAQQARAEGVLDRLVVVHADLGRVEWPGTRELAEQHARQYGLRFEVVTRKQGTSSSTSKGAVAGPLLLSVTVRRT